MNVYIWEEIPPLNFTANTANSTVQLTQTGSPTAVTLETSTDKVNWSTYTIWDTITLSNIWDKVYFRNTSETDTGFSIDLYNYYKFVMTWSISASWDTTSLLNKNWTDTLSNYCFYILFASCSALTTAPSLHATTLAAWCYTGMFQECSSLTTPPKLPATTLTERCYQQMFNSSWLTTVPKLPATTLASQCYNGMFAWCSSLTALPELPATTLTDYCYANMFYWCSNIKVDLLQWWEYQTPYRIPTTWTGSAGTGSFNNIFVSTWWAYTGSPSINETIYTSNTVV